jgi:translation elongation factor EF-G
MKKLLGICLSLLAVASVAASPKKHAAIEQTMIVAKPVLIEPVYNAFVTLDAGQLNAVTKDIEGELK